MTKEELIRAMVISADDMQKAITSKKESRARTGKKFDCVAVSGIDELSKFLENNPGLNRCQVLLQIDWHWIFIEADFTKNGKFLIIDAAGDQRHNIAIFYIESIFPNSKIFVSNGMLQKDFFSCAFFSWDHACQISKLDFDIFVQLEGYADDVSSGIFDVNPYILPPQLIRNVQSFRFVKDYLKRNPENKNSLVSSSGKSLNEFLIQYRLPKSTNKDGSNTGYKNGAISKAKSNLRKHINKR